MPTTPQDAFSRRRRTRRDRIPFRHGGFTMIELITAMAIMALLATIFLVAFKHVGGGSQKNQTRALLEQLKNITAEVTTDKAGSIRFYSLQLPSIYFPEPTANDFRNSGYISWIGTPASSLEAIDRTGRVLEALGHNAKAKQLIDELAADRKAKFTIQIGSNKQNIYSLPLDAWGHPVLFVPDNLQRPVAGGSLVPFTVPGGAGDVQVGGLTNLYTDAAKEYWETGLSPSPSYSDASAGASFPVGTLTPYSRGTDHADYVPHRGTTGATEATLRAPDHQPYWVSAGPDGKFETHDDNLYSFSN